MGRKCCVPKCKQGYAGVPKDPNVTFHLFKEEWRLKIHRGSKWKVTENTFICSKHFVASDFIIETLINVEGKQGVQQPGKPEIFREFDLPQGKPGKPGKVREFFCLSMRIF